jgi:hypothetical protein
MHVNWILELFDFALFLLLIFPIHLWMFPMFCHLALKKEILFLWPISSDTFKTILFCFLQILNKMSGSTGFVNEACTSLWWMLNEFLRNLSFA